MNNKLMLISFAASTILLSASDYRGLSKEEIMKYIELEKTPLKYEDETIIMKPIKEKEEVKKEEKISKIVVLSKSKNVEVLEDKKEEEKGFFRFSFFGNNKSKEEKKKEELKDLKAKILEPSPKERFKFTFFSTKEEGMKKLKLEEMEVKKEYVKKIEPNKKKEGDILDGIQVAIDKKVNKILNLNNKEKVVKKDNFKIIPYKDKYILQFKEGKVEAIKKAIENSIPKEFLKQKSFEKNMYVFLESYSNIAFGSIDIEYKLEIKEYEHNTYLILSTKVEELDNGITGYERNVDYTKKLLEKITTTKDFHEIY